MRIRESSPRTSIVLDDQAALRARALDSTRLDTDNIANRLTEYGGRYGRPDRKVAQTKPPTYPRSICGDFQRVSRSMLGTLNRAARVGVREGARVAEGLRREGLNFKLGGQRQLATSTWRLSSSSYSAPFAVVAAAGAAVAGVAWVAEKSIDRGAQVLANVAAIVTARLPSPSAPFRPPVASCEDAARAAVPNAAEASEAIAVEKLACSRSLSPGGQRQEGARPVVLVSCGSFNPPTIAHMKILDMVRAAYVKAGIDVYGAYLSPVHDAYQKPGLVDARHRVEMCRRAVASSTFVMVDGWEAAQVGYTRTLHVLDSIDARLRAAEGGADEDGGVRPLTPSTPSTPSTPRTVLVCGADVLESMGNPELWDQVLLEGLLRRHGVACVVRDGTDVERVLGKEGTLVSRWRDHVMVVEAGEDEMASIAGVSSTRVREACRLRGGRGLEGLVDGGVLAYIMQERLYVS